MSGTEEHLDCVSGRHLWRVAAPSSHLLACHHQGHRPRLGRVCAPTCQLCTPVKSTKTWKQPTSTCAALNPTQFGTRHIRINQNKKKWKLIWTFDFFQPFLPRDSDEIRSAALRTVCFCLWCVTGSAKLCNNLLHCVWTGQKLFFLVSLSSMEFSSISLDFSAVVVYQLSQSLTTRPSKCLLL